MAYMEYTLSEQHWIGPTGPVPHGQKWVQWRKLESWNSLCFVFYDVWAKAEILTQVVIFWLQDSKVKTASSLRDRWRAPAYYELRGTDSNLEINI